MAILRKKQKAKKKKKKVKKEKVSYLEDLLDRKIRSCGVEVEPCEWCGEDPVHCRCN